METLPKFIIYFNCHQPPVHRLSMTSRPKYDIVCSATQGVGGNNNLGIHIVRHRRSNQLYIEKRIRASDIQRGDVQREIRNMRQCANHPNVVALVDHDLSHRSVGYGSMFMQRGELGSLDAFILRLRQNGTWLPDEGFLWKVLLDISMGVCHLWTGQDAATARQLAMTGRSVPTKPGWNKILHRDLKPSNIFMTWGDGQQPNQHPHPTMLIGDFGCAVSAADIRAGQGNFIRLPIPDLSFAPPEFPAYGEESDVYGIALIVVCIVWRSQEPPSGNLFANNWATHSMARVLGRCLQRDPNLRPKPQDLPKLVWREYQMWLAGRSDHGRPMPEWVFAR
jgi:serine/threonine protein kinase